MVINFNENLCKVNLDCNLCVCFNMKIVHSHPFDSFTSKFAFYMWNFAKNSNKWHIVCSSIEYHPKHFTFSIDLKNSKRMYKRLTKNNKSTITTKKRVSTSLNKLVRNSRKIVLLAVYCTDPATHDDYMGTKRQRRRLWWWWLRYCAVFIFS